MSRLSHGARSRGISTSREALATRAAGRTKKSAATEEAPSKDPRVRSQLCIAPCWR